MKVTVIKSDEGKIAVKVVTPRKSDLLDMLSIKLDTGYLVFGTEGIATAITTIVPDNDDKLIELLNALYEV